MKLAELRQVKLHEYSETISLDTNQTENDQIFMKFAGPTEANSELLNRIGEVSIRLAGGPLEENSELHENIVIYG